MHKHDQVSVLLSALAEGHTITVACKRAGVSRMFYDRHYKSDLDFHKKADAARRSGKDTTDDRVSAAFLKKISEGDSRLIRYYLEHNVAPYKKAPERSEPASMHPVPEILSDAEAYEQFVLWSALTPEERSWRGVQTREQFCKMYGVPSLRLLDAWAQRADFGQRVAALREDWIIFKTGDVLGEIYTSARGGNLRSQKLWLDYAQRIKEKRDAAGPKLDRLSPDDVRQVIDMLPEGLRNNNYMRLQAIRDDIALYQQEQERKEREEAEIKERAQRAAILEYFKKPNGDIDWDAYSKSL
ncbi:MAG: hypothetical protein KGI70_00435 [Patescibacteria group bacterium]|nr:hypothetical protein [Patescibacteria group bacterium]